MLIFQGVIVTIAFDDVSDTCPYHCYLLFISFCHEDMHHHTYSIVFF